MWYFLKPNKNSLGLDCMQHCCNTVTMKPFFSQGSIKKNPPTMLCIWDAHCLKCLWLFYWNSQKHEDKILEYILWFFILLFVSFVFVCSDTAGHNPHVCIAKDRCHALNLILSKLFQKMKEKCSNLLILLYTWICCLQRQQNTIKWRLVPCNKAIFPQWSNFQMEALRPKSGQFSLR